MIIFDSLDQLNIDRPTAVTVGKFDGLHRGHRELINRVKKEAASFGLASLILTLENPERSRIYTDEEMTGILEELSVDYWVRIPFTEEIRSMDREDFLKNVLLRKLRMKVIVSGYDFSFGKDRKGNGDYLLEVEEELSFKYFHEATESDGEGAVSSTRIREALTDGRVEYASDCLGHDYFMEGTVVHGAHIGNSIGFPTVNLEVNDHKFLPLFGVYTIVCQINGKVYGGVANIGMKPTVNNVTKPVLEAHLFGCSEDLYGKKCRVSFISFIREERRLSSLEALKSQIALDKITAKRVLERLDLDKKPLNR